MNPPLKVLLLEDNLTDAELIAETLTTDGIKCNVVRVETEDEFIYYIENDEFNIVLADYSLPSFNCIHALEIVKEKRPHIPFIVVSGVIDEELGIEILKKGATDFIFKHRLSRLAPAVKRAIKEYENKLKRIRAEEELKTSLNKLFKKNRYLEIINTIMHAIHSSLNLDEVLENAVESMSKNIEGADNVSIYMVEGKEAVLKSYRGYPEWFIKRVSRIPYPKGFTWKTIIEGKLIYCPDVSKDTVIGPAGREMGTKSYASMPIYFNGETIGCININSLRENAFNEEELELLNTVARQIEIAITNAKHVENIKKAEIKIKEQAELLDKAKDAIVVEDLTQRVIYWNRGAQKLYRWHAEEVLGMDQKDFIVSGKSLSSFLKARETVIEKGEWMGELFHLTKEGKEIMVESSWTLILDEKGTPKSILMVNTDITEKKHLESQLLRAQRMESIGTLTGGIAHDLNNVLQPIVMAAGLMREKTSDASLHKLIDIIDANVKRGAQLLKQLLLFAKGFEGEYATVQIRHLLLDIERVLKETFPRSIEITVEVPKNLWTVNGNPTQLQQVIMNLCVNARDAMPEGGKLTLAAENTWVDEHSARMNIDARVGPYVTLIVSDTGTGIPSSIIDRIFEPFFSTKAEKGTGLGLSTVYRIVKDHKGFIKVYSEEGKGTTFKVYIPALNESEKEQGPKEEAIKAPRGREELVLLIEDEPSIREVTNSILKDYGYRVIAANNGAEGIELYLKNKELVKAVVVDMIMPIMDGVEVIQKLKAFNPDVKIIATSGLKENESLSKSLGVNEFLLKPYNKESLLNTLYKVIMQDHK